MTETTHSQPGPVNITEDIARLISGASSNGTPVAVSYVDEDGRPHLSLRGTVQVHDADHLAFWSRTAGLPAALATHPDIAFLYQDIPHRTFLAFSGRARVITDAVSRDLVFARSPVHEQAQDPDRRGQAVLVAIDSVTGRTDAGPLAMARAVGPRPLSPVGAAAARSGVVMTQMLIVADLERSKRFYRDVLGATVVRDDAPVMLRFYNGWLILNTGGGPTPDKPGVTVAPPEDPTRVSSFLNLRVADVDRVYAQWTSRGGQFLTAPLDNHGAERRCYLRDPDGYLIEVGQTVTQAA